MQITKSNNVPIFWVTLLLLIANMQTTSALSLYGLSIVVFSLCVLILFYHYPHILIEVLLLAIIFIFTLMIVTAIQLPDYSIYTGLNKIIISRALLAIFWILCMIIISGAINEVTNRQLSVALAVVIIVMSVFLILQNISYYFFNYIIDFSTMTGGELSRSYYSGLYRPAGFLPEPAVYSGHMAGLIALYMYYRKKANAIILLGLISILLTLSTVGVILVILLCLSYFVSIKKNPLIFIFILFLFVLFLTIISPLLVERFDLFINGNDTSNNLKLEAIINFFANEKILLFGYGMVGHDHPLLPDFYEAIKDVTIFGALFSIYGTIIGCILLFILSYYWISSTLDLKYKIILLIPLIKICSPGYLFFHIYMLLYFIVLRKGNKK